MGIKTMSFNSFSTSNKSANSNSAADKPKEFPSKAAPAVQAETKPVEAAPPAKS